MYLSFYNLTEKPFQISADPRFLWLGEKHKEALAILKYGIMDNRGFLLLTGDVGTGKTTLINALVNSLGEETIVAAIPDPGLDTLDFFNYVSRAFKIGKVFSSKGDFIYRFEIFLQNAYRNGKKVLLIIDEAQRLNHELLEEIRLLSNIENEDRKLLNIFFVGQIEFNDLLLKAENRALRQRITVNYNIDPLTESESKVYIWHRLQVAGANKNPFSAGAMHEIFLFSKGYPRLINIVCDHALLTGYVEESKTISRRIVTDCAGELQISAKDKDVDDVHIDSDKSGQPESNAPTSPSKRPKTQIVYLVCMILSLTLLAYVCYHLLYGEKGAIGIGKFADSVLDKLQISETEEQTADSFTYSINTLEEKSISPIPIPEKSNPQSVTKVKPGIQAETASLPPARDLDDVADDFSPAIPATESENTLSVINKTHVIYYLYNSNAIPDSAYPLLNHLADIMNSDANLNIDILGYTDASGGQSYNKKLSEFRASNVKSYLLGKGIDSERINARGMGSENTAISKASESPLKSNRRVEIKLKY